jgi:hypothetical protein
MLLLCLPSIVIHAVDAWSPLGPPPPPRAANPDAAQVPFSV